MDDFDLAAKFHRKARPYLTHVFLAGGAMSGILSTKFLFDGNLEIAAVSLSYAGAALFTAKALSQSLNSEFKRYSSAAWTCFGTGVAIIGYSELDKTYLTLLSAAPFFYYSFQSEKQGKALEEQMAREGYVPPPDNKGPQ